MTVPFRSATAVVPLSEAEFEADIPDQWQQGRGAFGGLIFGILLRAARAYEQDLTRVARSFACDVAGPVMVGKARVKVRELRRGRSQTNLQLELSQRDAVLASALCTMSGSRAGSAPDHEPSVPSEALQYDRAREVSLEGRSVFTYNYDYRNLGPVPLSGAAEPVVLGFVRELAGEGELDVPALSALLDSFWPAIFSSASKGFPMTTVSFNAQFLPGIEGLSAREPLFYRARAFTQREGYSVEFRELWTRERLIALNQQTFAVLG
jgi:hypothetical protein